MPHSEKRVKLRLGDEDVIWKLLRRSRCPHPQASLSEETKERLMMSALKDEGLGNLNVSDTQNLIMKILKTRRKNPETNCRR